MTFINIEYDNYGYTDDGSQIYNFVVTLFYNAGPAYYQYGYHPFAPVNSHKILEFLSMGKLVISNYFDIKVRNM